jgi:CubicO group peptidase (beta-lactamase class C family)
MIRMSRIIPTSFLIGFIVSMQLFSQPRQTEQESAKAVIDELDSFFSELMESTQLVGLSAGIVKNGKIAWSNGFGFADLEEKRPVTPDTLFHQGSVSKTITVAVFMHLWERSDFSLDDDINDYLPFAVRNPRFPDKPISFRMLLTHTSSIADVAPGENKLSVLNEERDSEVPLEKVLRGFLIPGGEYYSEGNYSESAPGEKYQYSNISFSLIGYIVERLSGKAFDAYCRETIFDPLEMKKTTWKLSEVRPEDFAYQYSLDRSTPGKKVKVQPYTWPGYMDGSLRTNVVEYANFLIMLMNRGEFEGKQILEPETIDIMLTLQEMGDNPPGRMFEHIGRALLWNKVRVGDYEIFHFNGFGSGFFTEVYFDPEKKTGGMFFITGEFTSFPVMGESIQEIVESLLDASDKL